MLHEYQAAFASAVLAPGNTAVPAGVAGNSEATALGLRVYRNNSAHARVMQLNDAYPVVARLLGDQCMTTLALDMAAARPVPGCDVRSWTVQLPEFIAETPLAAMLPYLADVARIEAARLSSLHGPDPQPQPVERLASAETLTACRLSFAVTTRLLMSEHSAVAVWLAENGGSPSHDADRHAIVYRSGLGVEVLPVSSAATEWLTRLDGGLAATDVFALIAGDKDAETLVGMLLAAGAIVIRTGDTE
jgi:hypothetical protein